jgi:nucleotide-binding universal stress UspA family protein
VFGGRRPPGLRTDVREGNAARVLLEASEGARMLVVGSRGHGGFAGLLLGSVSAACAEHASCPVLVLHGTTPPPPAPLASGG